MNRFLIFPHTYSKVPAISYVIEMETSRKKQKKNNLRCLMKGLKQIFLSFDTVGNRLMGTGFQVLAEMTDTEWTLDKLHSSTCGTRYAELL